MWDKKEISLFEGEEKKTGERKKNRTRYRTVNWGLRTNGRGKNIGGESVAIPQKGRRGRCLKQQQRL